LIAHLTTCDEQARARFRLERSGDGVELSSGSLVWGSPSADDVPDGPEGGEAPAAVAAVLPHTGPSRLLDSVVVLGPGQVAGHGRVPAAHAAARSGRVPAFLAVEVAAQAAAQVPKARHAASGAGGAAGGGAAGDDAAGDDAAAAVVEPRLGYLVRLREVRFARAEIEVETPLVAHLDLAGRTGPLARFDFVVVLSGGEPIAAGSLATWDLVPQE
jgi:hypothetical protein